ncbi:hypothetical protein [Massilia sp. TSP1-1-2]|uniref:hypothetical protein n=1 Tax=Massilia sp. TSP1-1-2 TaxID=2804649 RepID=UPI003CEA0B93
MLARIWMALGVLGKLISLVGHFTFRVASVAFLLPWLLRLFEIPSVFDRWLPGFSHWELLAAAAIAYVGSYLFLKGFIPKDELRKMLSER